MSKRETGGSKPAERSTSSVWRADAERLVRESTAAQGLPLRVEDPVIVRQLATILRKRK